MVLHLKNWPPENVMALPCWPDMYQRSGKGAGMSDTDRIIYRASIKSSEDAQSFLGFLAVELPSTAKVTHRFALVSPTPLSAADESQLRAKDELGATGGCGSRSAHCIDYEPAARLLTVRVGVATFNGSMPVDGASVGAPPPSIPDPKYVLGLGWVASSTPVPSPAELHGQSATLEEYPL
jgi:hypothetical protein